MLSRPNANEYPHYFESYINKVPEGELRAFLGQQIEDAWSQLSNLSEEQGCFRYAEGKWSAKEVLGHITDTERIMSYRLLRIARGDTTPLPGFNEELFVSHANFDSRTVEDLFDEFTIVRTATLSLMNHLSDEAWLRMGAFSGEQGSARALAYIIAGHALHHFNVIRERYLQV